MKAATRALAAFSLALALFDGAVQAQVFPDGKAIRVVVPYPPGGPNDVVGRIYAERLTARFGTPAVVDNKPGASGTIGGEFVARSKADGLTLLVAAPSSTTINAGLMPNMPFDPVKDFTAVSTLATTVMVLVANPALNANSVKELVALSKASGKPLTFGSAGTGSAGHLSGEMFRTMTGANITHVPYKGGAPAMADLLGGHIDLMFADITVASTQVRAGKVKPLAVTGSTRARAMPDVPTVKESGFPEYEVVSWFGVVAPAGTPREVIRVLHEEAQRMNESPEYRTRLEPLGAEPAPITPEAFQLLLARDVEKWRKVIRESGAKAD